MIRLWLPAPLEWRRQPMLHKARGRLYPHPDTERGILRWRGAWLASEREQIHGPVMVILRLVVARPPSHRKRDGSLNTRGDREPWPRGKPDVDNVAKLALDAIKGYAIDDDSNVVHLTVSKAWAGGERPGSDLWIRAAPVPERVAVDAEASAPPPHALSLDL